MTRMAGLDCAVVCSMYGHIYSKSKDQPGKVANPARGQLNRKNQYFLVPVSRLKIWSRETGSAVPSRVILLISILLRLNLVLTYGVPPEFRDYGQFNYTQTHTQRKRERERERERETHPHTHTHIPAWTITSVEIFAKGRRELQNSTNTQFLRTFTLSFSG